MRRLAAIGNLLLIGLLAAGCQSFNSDRILGETIVLRNGTSDTIEISTVRDGIESTLATIEPGRGYTISAAQFTDGCLAGPFVARSDDATVVETRGGGLCSGDTWEVVARTAPSAS